MAFIYGIHITACVFLVITVLMQAGRGGGLTETFQSAESMFGTQTNVILVRTTSILAAIFLSTSLYLAFVSSKGNKSLMSNRSLLATVPKTPETSKPQESDVQVKVGAPTPVVPATPVASSAEQRSGNIPVTNAAK